MICRKENIIHIECSEIKTIYKLLKELKEESLPPTCCHAEQVSRYHYNEYMVEK